MLIGLLRAPTEYDPFVNPGPALLRRNQVLQNLVAVGDLSQAVANKYKAQPIRLATKSPPKVREGCANAVTTIKNVGFFCDYAVNWLETVRWPVRQPAQDRRPQDRDDARREAAELGAVQAVHGGPGDVPDDRRHAGHRSEER